MQHDRGPSVWVVYYCVLCQKHWVETTEPCWKRDHFVGTCCHAGDLEVEVKVKYVKSDVKT